MFFMIGPLEPDRPGKWRLIRTRCCCSGTVFGKSLGIGKLATDCHEPELLRNPKLRHVPVTPRASPRKNPGHAGMSTDAQQTRSRNLRRLESELKAARRGLWVGG